MRGEGVAPVLAAGPGVAQALFQGEGIGQAIRAYGIGRSAVQLRLAGLVQAGQAAVKVCHGDQLRAFGGKLWIKILRHPVYRPGEIDLADAAGQKKREKEATGQSPKGFAHLRPPHFLHSSFYSNKKM